MFDPFDPEKFGIPLEPFVINQAHIDTSLAMTMFSAANEYYLLAADPSTPPEKSMILLAAADEITIDAQIFLEITLMDPDLPLLPL